MSEGARATTPVLFQNFSKVFRIYILQNIYWLGDCFHSLEENLIRLLVISGTRNVLENGCSASFKVHTFIRTKFKNIEAENTPNKNNEKQPFVDVLQNRCS